MDLFKGALALESAQLQNGQFAEELLEEMQRLRDLGDYSQAAMKKCKVTALTRLYTHMDVQFVVSDKIRDNAYFILPAMDRNHPFFGAYGFDGAGSSAATLQSIRDAGGKPREGTVDLRTGRVSGYFKDIKVTIVLAHNLFTDSKYKTEMLVGIYLHELGHTFTYFEYFGNIVRSSFLIDQASKTVMDPGYNSETKVKLLKEVEKQLGVENLESEKTINLPSDKARTKVETVLITDDVFNTRTESSTPFYDVRTVEQMADQFCTVHGAGVWQAEALGVLYKKHRVNETISAAEFVAIEIVKLVVFLVVGFLNPIMVFMYALALMPSPHAYDQPKERLITLKRQLISALKANSDPAMKKRYVDDIKAVETLIDELTSRRTLYELYCNYLDPVGRRMYNEEKFRKKIEEAINNDLYVKAAELGAK